jgi:hypothetical protein
MKSLKTSLLTCLLAGFSLPLAAATYNDATGDGALVGTGGGILDISSVEVNNTLTDLIFKINLAGNPVATDWGKYMIGLDTTAGGDSAGNGWGRPISMSGMDYWIGGWADFGNGAELRQYTGTWGGPSPLTFSKDTSSVTIQLTLAALGLAPGSSFNFDVYTSGGGGTDGAIDALSNPSQTIGGWSDAYNSTLVSTYTVSVIPEPTTLALFGLGGLLVWRRFSQSRN